MMWHKTDITPTDFKTWFEKNKLGRLYFPVGQTFTPIGCYFEHGEVSEFFIELNDLFEMVVGWKINKQDVPIEDIIAIIAFGSAVGPRYSTLGIRKKYLVCGPHVPILNRIQPEDADFLVITKQNMINEKFLQAISIETYDCGTWIKKGGIHLVNRGQQQVIKGFDNNDTISINAIRSGIPVFYTPEFDDLLEKLGIEELCLMYDMLWEKTTDGYLIGDIGNEEEGER